MNLNPSGESGRQTSQDTPLPAEPEYMPYLFLFLFYAAVVLASIVASYSLARKGHQ